MCKYGWSNIFGNINLKYFSRMSHPQRVSVQVSLQVQRDGALQVHDGGERVLAGVVRHADGRGGEHGGRDVGVLSCGL